MLAVCTEKIEMEWRTIEEEEERRGEKIQRMMYGM